MKINPRALGFTLGVIWGVAILLVTLGSLWTGRSYGRHFLDAIASIYPGYTITSGGAILGLFYGFVDAFVFGWLAAHLYNFFAKEK
jgi:hypothetical protein